MEQTKVASTWRRVESSPSTGPEHWALQLLICYFTDVTSKKYNPEHDVAYIKKRFSHEGLALVTRTLPKFGAAILDGFREGKFTCPAGFVLFKARQWAALPKFLSALLVRVFHSETGILRSMPDSESAGILHQICSMFKKLEAKMTDELVDEHFESMLAFDDALPKNLDNIDPSVRFVVNHASKLVHGVLRCLDLRDIIPKHGKGAVSTKGIHNYEKQNLHVLHTLYTPRLNAKYPWFRYFFTHFHNLAVVEEDGQVPIAFAYEKKSKNGSRAWRGGGVQYPGLHPRGTRYFGNWSSFAEWWAEACCTRTLCVPKTATKLRTISAEPVPNMAIQLGQQKAIVSRIESHPHTRGHVNFRTQNVNRALALTSSLDNRWATLDLKSASDSVTVSLVRELFPTDVFELLFASRTAHTSITWKKTGYTSYRKLTKFAPMGSGVCFPVESIVFWALACGIIYRSMSYKDMNRCMTESIESVYTYGDDLIVPRQYADEIAEIFAALGLIVNETKSFTTGPFRESCGLDAFAGIEITPVKVKAHPPEEKNEGSNAAAWNDYAADFQARGLQHCAEFCYKQLEKIYGPLPYRFAESNYLGRVDDGKNIIPDFLQVFQREPGRVGEPLRTNAKTYTRSSGCLLPQQLCFPFLRAHNDTGHLLGPCDGYVETSNLVNKNILDWGSGHLDPDDKEYRKKRTVRKKVWAVKTDLSFFGHTGADGLWRWFTSMKGSDQDALLFADEKSRRVEHEYMEILRW